jgi:hypothetical protein
MSSHLPAATARQFGLTALIVTGVGIVVAGIGIVVLGVAGGVAQDAIVALAGIGGAIAGGLAGFLSRGSVTSPGSTPPPE